MLPTSLFFMVTVELTNNVHVLGCPVFILLGAYHPEAPRVRGTRHRTQDGHKEREKLHRGADPGWQELTDQPPVRKQQGCLTGWTIFLYLIPRT